MDTKTAKKTATVELEEKPLHGYNIRVNGQLITATSTGLRARHFASIAADALKAAGLAVVKKGFMVLAVLLFSSFAACNVQQTAGVINGTVAPEEAANAVEPTPTPSPTPWLTNCPAGMLPAYENPSGSNVCVDVENRAPAYRAAAVSTCGAENLEVCSVADYEQAAAQGWAGLLGYLQTNEITSPGYMRMMINGSPSAPVSVVSAAYLYRCCGVAH